MPSPRSPKDAVDPRSDRPADRATTDLILARRRLIADGWSEADSAWLAPTILAVLTPTASILEDRLEMRLDQFSWIRSQAGVDRNAALLAVLALLTGGIPPSRIVSHDHVDEGWDLPDPEREAVLRVAWPAPLLERWSQQFDGDDAPGFARFRRLLRSTGAMRLDRLVDLDALIHSGRSGNWTPQTSSSMASGAITWADGITWATPTSLRPWIWYDGPGCLESLLPHFRSAAPEDLAPLAIGIVRELLACFGCRAPRLEIHHFSDFARTDANLRQTLRPFFAHVQDVARDAARQQDPDLRRVRLLLFRLTYDGAPEECPADTRKELLQLATEDLARLRSSLAEAGTQSPDPAAERFAREQPHFDNCCRALATHDGIWRCWKPLLLATRALSVPCVARDLRYWHEVGLPPPPMPWNRVPSMIAGVLHGFAAREQVDDPTLEKLRQALASFCLDRLKDRRTNDKRADPAAVNRPRTDADMVEPVAAWRFCLARAVDDLCTNPEGRGHRTLHWSSQHDPDPDVRDAARSAYHTLRHAAQLPANVSPRRAVMRAFWWLRQAHLLGLGIQPDRDLAQRTREKELTRTKEVERADPSASS
jgi:hypothetical protein